MKKHLILFFLMLCFFINEAQAQTTYNWNRTDSSDFQVAGNWTPARTTPAANDILVFGNGAAGTIAYNMPTQTISGFQVILNTNVKIYNSFAGAVTISITGGSTPNLFVGASSNLTFSATVATNTIVMNLATGTTGLINGTFTFTSTVTATGHRLQAIDANAITFLNGSAFNYGPFAGGNAFGGGTGVSGVNSVVFNSGSTFYFKSVANGANPFGATAPASVVNFQTGSTYEHQSNLSPSFSGRTYANYVQNFAGSAINGTGAGTLSMDNITVTDGALNLNMTGRVNVKGNINVAAGKTLTFSPASSDSIFFNGAAQQTINNSGTLTFAAGSRAIINNSLGVLLNTSISVPQLILQTGNIILGPNNLTTTTLTGGSSSSYIQTSGAGTLTINNVGASDVIFPVGRTSYNPVTINNAGTADNFTVGVQNTIDNPTFDNTHAVQRQWNISEAVAGGSNAALTFQWATANEGGSMTHTGMFVGHWNGASYDLFPTTIAGADPAWTVLVSGITTFSPFVVGDNVSLPVELSSFTSSVLNNKVILNWSTVSEQNNSGFEIERKSNSTSWAKLNFIKGNGTSSLTHNYSFTDNHLATGNYNYRLKQIDFNGNFKYYDLSNEVIVGIPSKFSLSQNYPNPFNPETKINYSLPVSNFVTLKIFDMSGKEIMQLVNEKQDAGYYTVRFNAAGLASGTYFYKLNADGFSEVKKMMVIK